MNKTGQAWIALQVRPEYRQHQNTKSHITNLTDTQLQIYLSAVYFEQFYLQAQVPAMFLDRWTQAPHTEALHDFVSIFSRKCIFFY